MSPLILIYSMNSAKSANLNKSLPPLNFHTVRLGGLLHFTVASTFIQFVWSPCCSQTQPNATLFTIWFLALSKHWSILRHSCISELWIKKCLSPLLHVSRRKTEVDSKCSDHKQCALEYLWPCGQEQMSHWCGKKCYLIAVWMTLVGCGRREEVRSCVRRNGWWQECSCPLCLCSSKAKKSRKCRCPACAQLPQPSCRRTGKPLQE